MRTRQTQRRWEVEACFSFALVQGDAAAAALRDVHRARQGEHILRERRQRQRQRQQQQQSSGLYSSIRSTLGILGGGGRGGGGGEVCAMESGDACASENGGGGGWDVCDCSHRGGGSGGEGESAYTCQGGGAGGCAIMEAIKSSPRHMVRPSSPGVDPELACAHALDPTCA